MKIPINWLKEFVNLPEKTSELTNKLTMVGHMLDKIEVVNGEKVIDLELRGNRADCYSIFGIAREVSAIFGSKLKSPQTVEIRSGKIPTNLLVKSNYVKRVGMIEIRNVKITKSPKWLSDRLTAYGMESVNNIVDLTNYVMIEVGEPMHAFDLDKIGKNIEIRMAKNGEKITTFMGTTITLTNQDLVWAKEGQVLSVAGAIGEKYHSISDSTKNILLEAANYDRANIRRSVYRHKLLTDAGIRHEKELDPNLVDIALSRFLYFVKKYNWGEFKPLYFDYYPKKVTPRVISFDFESINSLGGTEITKQEAAKILKGLLFEVNGDKVTIPTFRTDVTRREDVVEEVLRIYGYDKIPTKTLSAEIPNSITPSYINQEISLRESATSVGFSEAISLSFVKEKFDWLNIHPSERGRGLISLENPPSPDNRDLRVTLLPNLYEIAIKAANQMEAEIALFEIGKVYWANKGKFEEKRRIAFVFKGSFANFKSQLNGFFEKSGIGKISYDNFESNLPLKQTFKILHKNVAIGFGGKIDDFQYVEIDLDGILNAEEKYKVALWPKYPPQVEDITLVFPEKTKIGSVMELMGKGAELKDVYKDAYTFRVYFQDKNKTLDNTEVEKLRSAMLAQIKSKFGGKLKE